ncbi:uncharacterized protein [Ambystoma mexicanum]
MYNWRFVFGANRLSKLETGVEVREPAEIIVHEQYDKESETNDIALVRLKAAVEFSSYIQPACIPKESMNITAMTRCHVSGWGVMQANVYNTADVLQEARVDLIPYETCNSLNWYNGAIGRYHLCAAYEKGQIDSCQGDSGGPLMCQDPESHIFFVVGVTSWGNGCGRPQKPGVYSATQYFLGWILNTVVKKNTQGSTIVGLPAKPLSAAFHHDPYNGSSTTTGQNPGQPTQQIFPIDPDRGTPQNQTIRSPVYPAAPQSMQPQINTKAHLPLTEQSYSATFAFQNPFKNPTPSYATQQIVAPQNSLYKQAFPFSTTYGVLLPIINPLPHRKIHKTHAHKISQPKYIQINNIMSDLSEPPQKPTLLLDTQQRTTPYNARSLDQQAFNIPHGTQPKRKKKSSHAIQRRLHLVNTNPKNEEMNANSYDFLPYPKNPKCGPIEGETYYTDCDFLEPSNKPLTPQPLEVFDNGLQSTSEQTLNAPYRVTGLLNRETPSPSLEQVISLNYPREQIANIHRSSPDLFKIANPPQFMQPGVTFSNKVTNYISYTPSPFKKTRHNPPLQPFPPVTQGVPFQRSRGRTTGFFIKVLTHSPKHQGIYGPYTTTDESIFLYPPEPKHQSVSHESFPALKSKVHPKSSQTIQQGFLDEPAATISRNNILEPYQYRKESLPFVKQDRLATKRPYLAAVLLKRLPRFPQRDLP